MMWLLYFLLLVSCVIFAREWKKAGRSPVWVGLSLFNVITVGSLYASLLS